MSRRQLLEITPEDADAIRAGVAAILRNYYPGAGGGRPRVSERQPIMLSGIRDGLLMIMRLGRARDPADRRFEESADLCVDLVDRLLVTCEGTRRDTGELVAELRQGGDRIGIRWDLTAEQRVAEGSLPFSSGEICPVSSYGYMEPVKYGNPPQLNVFAKRHLRDYEELDEYGRIAHGWARQLALAARDQVGW